jgi:hypothetical protein
MRDNDDSRHARRLYMHVFILLRVSISGRKVEVIGGSLCLRRERVGVGEKDLRDM